MCVSNKLLELPTKFIFYFNFVSKCSKVCYIVGVFRGGTHMGVWGPLPIYNVGPVLAGILVCRIPLRPCMYIMQGSFACISCRGPLHVYHVGALYLQILHTVCKGPISVGAPCLHGPLIAVGTFNCPEGTRTLRAPCLYELLDLGVPLSAWTPCLGHFPKAQEPLETIIFRGGNGLIGPPATVTH